MTRPTVVPGLDGEILETITQHIYANADREVGGVLIGLVAERDQVPLVIGAIEAASAGEERASLTFTQSTWEHIHSVMETHYPDDRIVGWYHSHPGFGIFLSEHDLFIHRHFFSGGSQIALVVDPLAGTEGVFGWDGEEIVQWYERPATRPGLGYGAFDTDHHDPIPPPTGRARADLTAQSALSNRRLQQVLVAIIGLIVGITLWEGFLRDSPPTPAPAPIEVRP